MQLTFRRLSLRRCTWSGCLYTVGLIAASEPGPAGGSRQPWGLKREGGEKPPRTRRRNGRQLVISQSTERHPTPLPGLQWARTGRRMTTPTLMTSVGGPGAGRPAAIVGVALATYRACTLRSGGDSAIRSHRGSAVNEHARGPDAVKRREPFRATRNDRKGPARGLHHLAYFVRLSLLH